jgi:hypothetical protein
MDQERDGNLWLPPGELNLLHGDRWQLRADRPNDSAHTTSFGRHDFFGVITEDSVKRLKWVRPPASGKLPTRL